MGPGKERQIREEVACRLNHADHGFLRMQTDPGEFARSLADELVFVGVCSRAECDDEVLPYLLQEQDYLDALRRRVLRGETLEADGISLFSDVLKELGSQIRSARKRHGMSQQDVAESAGTTQAQISRIERGYGLGQPTLDLLDRVARAVGQRLDVRLRKGA